MSEDQTPRMIALIEGARKTMQLADICADWNLEEVEIDGEMVNVRTLGDEAKAAIGEG